MATRTEEEPAVCAVPASHRVDGWARLFLAWLLLGSRTCGRRRMRRSEVGWARATDGAYLAYPSFGTGPTELFWQEGDLAVVDEFWDSPPERAWHEGLADFARVTIYDKRGIGLSSRNVGPGNLETQVDDVLAVMDAQGIDRAVLGGILEAGAPNVLLAATHPQRVDSLVWMNPTPRTTATADYPWGVDEEYVERDLLIQEAWGTTGWADDFIALNNDVMGGVWGTQEYRGFLARVARRSCTPDVARELSRIWNETDVRAVLPAIQAPTLLVTSGAESDLALARSVADQILRAEIFTFTGPSLELGDFAPIHSAIQRFIGAERPRIGMDSVLATVLFTDIVESTITQASLGDRAWKELIERHHALVRGLLVQWRGVENDTAGDGFYATFDGPARAIRCALEITERVRELGLQVRAGIHTGDCERIDGKVGGLAVTIGARISVMAQPSQVLVSQTVKDLVAGSGFAFHDAGEHELKGVPYRWHVYSTTG